MDGTPVIRFLSVAVAISGLLLVAGCGGAKPAPTPAGAASSGTPAPPAAAGPASDYGSTAPVGGSAEAPAASAPAASAPSPAASGAGVVNVNMVFKDYSFEPKEITVTRGQKVVMTIKNDGERGHNLVFSGPYDGMKSPRIDAGASGTFEFVADKTGTLEFICDVRGHKERGMVGKLTVNEP